MMLWILYENNISTTMVGFAGERTGSLRLWSTGKEYKYDIICICGHSKP